MSRFASAATSAALGLALAAVAFGAKGGSDLGRVTAVELFLVLAGGVAVAGAAAYGRMRSLPGAPALALFALLAAVTALSVVWSIAPELSWIEANRTLAYLAAFAAALAAAWLAPTGWAVVLRGILVGAGLVVCYALASRVWPTALAEHEIYARIGQPYGYWNAVGVTAALAVPPTLWLGARRSGHGAANALAYPLMALLMLALVLTYSRGALATAAAGVALWLAIVPLRLRSLALLGVAAAGAAPVIAWALSKDAFTRNLIPIEARGPVGPEFGLLFLSMTVVLAAVGLAIGFRVARRAPATSTRRRLGAAAATAAVALPLVLLTSVAASDRGLAGTISDRVGELTSETTTTPGGPSRLTTASSARGRYWRQAGRVFSDHPATGTGAGTFGLARLRYRSDDLVARHAHGQFAQTLADLGLVGLLALLALTGAWLVAAARATGIRWRPRGRPDPERPRAQFDAERVGLVALTLTAVVFGLHSTIDFTWFVPGPVVMALVAGGFVAGRGRQELAGERSRPPQGVRRLLPVPERSRLLLAVGVLVATGICAWAVVQPKRADDAASRALRLLSAGDVAAAAESADDAYSINPLSPRPLVVKAAVEEGAGRPQAALGALRRAVVEHPADPQSWQALAEFHLRRLDQPAEALEALRGVLFLDPRSKAGHGLFLEARARLRSPSVPGPDSG